MRREYTRPSPVLQSLTAVQFTSNRKMPAPCTKNGRCSLKKVSNAVRLSTAGSASTWPKSGLTVASRVRFDATRYFRSPPPAMSCVRPIPVLVNSDTFLVRSEEHTSELQSRFDLVCRLLLEKKK